jgi:hypothetical protein
MEGLETFQSLNKLAPKINKHSKKQIFQAKTNEAGLGKRDW